MIKSKDIPVCLTVAGSDSGGGAGIQADLKTFSLYNVFGCSVITAVTAQNPTEVTSIHPLPTSSIVSQFKTVTRSLTVKSIKLGMLFSSDIIQSLTAEIDSLPRKLPLVVDPVMIASSGSTLTNPNCIQAYEKGIFARATLITPNIPEAELLSGQKIYNGSDMIAVGVELSKKYNTNILLKGGHLGGEDMISDFVLSSSGNYEFKTPFVSAPTSHGTGCILSSAIAANLALGKNLFDSISEAKGFVFASLKNCKKIGTNLFALGLSKQNSASHVKFIQL